MRLNHDCIRDILIFIEDNTDNKNRAITSTKLIKNLNNYDENILFYHIRLMDSAKLFSIVNYDAMKNPNIIGPLSWTGHSYLDNIRDKTIWDKIKHSSSKFTSISLPILIEKAAEIAFKSF